MKAGLFPYILDSLRLKVVFNYFSTKDATDDTIPAVMPNEMSSKESRQNWARLIQKIYEFDPFVCPKCQGQMRIISFIEELDVSFDLESIDMF